jgi:hypothetical protein
VATYNGIRSNYDTASGSSIACSASITVAIGDLIHVGVKYEGGTTTCSVSDGLGNTFTPVDKTNHSLGEPELAVFRCVVANPGSCTPSATLGAARVFRAIFAHYFTPAVGSSFAADSPGFKNGQGSGTAISTGAFTANGAGVASTFAATYTFAGVTAGSGWTETYDADTGYAEYRILSGGGSITGDATSVGGDRWVATAINTLENSTLQAVGLNPSLYGMRRTILRPKPFMPGNRR